MIAGAYNAVGIVHGRAVWALQGLNEELARAWCNWMMTTGQCEEIRLEHDQGNGWAYIVKRVTAEDEE